MLAFLWATGISVIRSGALPKWLGWIADPVRDRWRDADRVHLGAAAAIWILIVSIMLTLRARSGRRAAPAAPPPAAPARKGRSVGRRAGSDRARRPDRITLHDVPSVAAERSYLGEVSEWLKELAWKASGRAYTCLVGSNPTLSAPIRRRGLRGVASVV